MDVLNELSKTLSSLNDRLIILSSQFDDLVTEFCNLESRLLSVIENS